MDQLSVSDLGAAGPVLAILLLLSVVSIAILVSRLLGLRSVAWGGDARDKMLSMLEKGDIPQSDVDPKTPADRVIRRAIELFKLDATPDTLNSDLTGLGNGEVAGMSRGIRVLELVGMIAPLLGLLGTVLGMIQSFRSLELAAGSANASILAGGIWQALLTTAAGLIVAIPALVGASYLSSRVEAGTLQIERVIQRVSVAAARLRGADRPK